MAMQESLKIDYTFYGSSEPLEGIAHADITRFERFVHAPYNYYGRFLWQPEAIHAAIGSSYDAIIYLGDPNFASTWVGAILARLQRKPILFWAHGWLRPESGYKRRLRNLFFKISSRILVYAERAKILGVKAGYPEEQITVVYNSLDVSLADQIVAEIEAGALNTLRPQFLFEFIDRPLLICTARLTPLCRFDLLIDAAAKLAARNRPVNVLLVGDGPARLALEKHAKREGVPVHFYGACYDERVIGQLIYFADITVSPGKIGLTAMHSLMYGTPAITHGNLNEQMPEVEAIEVGRTGLLFQQGDATALADAIECWLDTAVDRHTVRSKARAVIHEKWNPTTQAKIIEDAVLDIIGIAGDLR
jgi:glycosyltransferase involved in cell wall biosynthesis